MAVNKVEYGNRVLIDLTEDTVTAANLLKDIRAHDKTGNLIVGQLESGSGGAYNVTSVSNGDGTQTLQITTAGSESGKIEADSAFLTKTIVQTTTSSGTYTIFSKTDLQKAGILGPLDTMSQAWENYMVELRAVRLNQHTTNQFIRAFASNGPTLLSADGSSKKSLRIAFYHGENASVANSYSDSLSITYISNGHIYDQTHICIKINTDCVISPGTYMATIVAWGRKA